VGIEVKPSDFKGKFFTFGLKVDGDPADVMRGGIGMRDLFADDNLTGKNSPILALSRTR